MCNRYAIENPDNVDRWIKQHLDAEFRKIIQQIGVKFTASPTDLLPVVTTAPGGRPEVRAMKWGVWFNGKGPYMNAKKELALRNWRDSVQNRRCFVPADAFFEWPPLPPKTPWIFRRPGNHPFGFAGIYITASSDMPDTFAFLTTTPTSLTASIGHQRSPVILTEANAAAWIRLGELTEEALASFTVPFDGEMSRARVTMRMNRSGYQQPDAVQPLTPEEIASEVGATRIISAERENGDQLSLF